MTAWCSDLLSYASMRTRSPTRTDTVRALNAVPPAIGLPGHVVDRLGIEPSTEGLQSDPVHQHPARGASWGRLELPPRADEARMHHPSYCAGRSSCVESATGLEPACRSPPAPQTPCPRRDPNARYGHSNRCLRPPRLRRRQAPGQGLEARFQRPERRVLPSDDPGRRCPAGGSTRRAPRQRAARAAHVGVCGETRSAIRASAGVRSPLR